MNSETQGAMALFVFVLLLFFFLAAWAVAAEAVQQQLVTAPDGINIINPAVTPVPVTVPLINANQAGAVQPLLEDGAATLSGDAIRYTVQPGEWLRLIAQRYNTTVDAILAVNPQITDPDVLSPGQEILIPAPGN